MAESTGGWSGVGAAANSVSSWTDLPLHVLQAELRRRQDEGEKPECGTKGGRGVYNTPLHVFALILILVLSTAACAFPIIARRFPKFPIPHYFLFLSRHFGTGVLIATAFVHLLPTAFTSLTDPCLPYFWNKRYPAMPGLIAMCSVLIVVGIEMFFATRGAGHIHGGEYGATPAEENQLGTVIRRRRGSSLQQGANGTLLTPAGAPGERIKRFRQAPIGDEEELLGGDGVRSDSQTEWSKVPQRSPLVEEDEQHNPRPTNAMLEDDEYFDEDAQSRHSSELDLDLDELDPHSSPKAALTSHSRNHSHRRSNSLPQTHALPADPAARAALERRLLLQCMLLEAGILFHSIFIGMALSVSTGPPFVVLLIAISFHQTFEGLALGSRIAAIPTLTPTSLKPWLMALAYGTTTPIGQAIGLAVHNLYDPQGQTGLLTVGVMNAVSSGLLLFAGLVELLAEDFLSDASYETLKGRRRKEACGAVVGGAFLMALVGAWA